MVEGDRRREEIDECRESEKCRYEENPPFRSEEEENPDTAGDDDREHSIEREDAREGEERNRRFGRGVEWEGFQDLFSHHAIKRIIRDEGSDEEEGEENDWKNTSLEESLPYELTDFSRESEDKYGYAEDRKSLDADEGEEDRREKNSEIMSGGFGLKKFRELKREEEKEKEREVFRECEVGEECRDKTG